MGTSSLFCPSYNPFSLLNKQRFVKNKILKYKIRQLQFNTALDNSKKQTPILETLPVVIHEMPDSKCVQTDCPYIDRYFLSRQAVGRKHEAGLSCTVPGLSVV